MACFSTFMSIFCLLGIPTVTLTNYSAGLLCSCEVIIFVGLYVFFVSKCGEIYTGFSACIFSTAHSAYTFDELANAIRQAYVGISEVFVLPKFPNWTASIDPYLNDSSTEGKWPVTTLVWIKVCGLFSLHTVFWNACAQDLRISVIFGAFTSVKEQLQ